jgi:transposase
MIHIQGTPRSQTLLLPACVDDYVGPDNVVRFIEAFVDSLDLTAAGFDRTLPKATGRPGYNPSDMLKLYVYGYLNRVRSSRRLEMETHRNLEVIWLMRQLQPDHKTIADFRRDNRAAFKRVFREFTVLCRNLGLLGREMIAVDGTKIRAVNSRDRNFTKGKISRELQRCDIRLDKYLMELDEADKDDRPNLLTKIDPQIAADKITALKARRARLIEYREELERTGKDQLSLTDPDAKSMGPSTPVGVGYNVQIAVDTKHSLIVEQKAHSKVSDLGLLTETAVAAKEALNVASVDVVADRGYYKIEDIISCEDAGVIPHIPKPNRSPAAANGRFPKSQFAYLPEKDVYVCPGGAEMKPIWRSKTRDEPETGYANISACGTCTLKPKCTSSKHRRIRRYDREGALDQMAVRMADRPELARIRRSTVEHPFGSIKKWMGQDAFLMRGLENVRGEFSLTALAYNIRRAINLVGLTALIQAAKG